MNYIAEIGTEHPQESIRVLLSDPHFVIPRVFKKWGSDNKTLIDS